MQTKWNSLESLQIGLSNADIAEFDVQALPDGTPVLSHDNPPPADAPLLKQAFEILAAHPGKRVNLDLKAFDHLPTVQHLAEEAGVLAQVFFTGVRAENAPKVQTYAPKIPYYLNFDISFFKKHSKAYAEKLVAKTRECGACGINCNHRNATAVLVRTFHQNGLLVSLWTAKSEKKLKKCFHLSADNVTTTLPDLANKMLAGRANRSDLQ